jgi:hypothetical protein
LSGKTIGRTVVLGRDDARANRSLAQKPTMQTRIVVYVDVYPKTRMVHVVYPNDDVTADDDDSFTH